MKKRVFIFLAVLSIVFFSYIVTSADRGQLPSAITRLYQFSYGDKVGHFLLMGSLAFVVMLALPASWKMRGMFILAGLLILEELSQGLFTRRTFDLLDLVCSLMGVAVFGAINLWLTHPRKHGKDNL